MSVTTEKSYPVCIHAVMPMPTGVTSSGGRVSYLGISTFMRRFLPPTAALSSGISSACATFPVSPGIRLPPPTSITAAGDFPFAAVIFSAMQPASFSTEGSMLSSSSSPLTLCSRPSMSVYPISSSETDSFILSAVPKSTRYCPIMSSVISSPAVVAIA